IAAEADGHGREHARADRLPPLPGSLLRPGDCRKRPNGLPELRRRKGAEQIAGGPGRLRGDDGDPRAAARGRASRRGRGRLGQQAKMTMTTANELLDRCVEAARHGDCETVLRYRSEERRVGKEWRPRRVVY